ncbi:ribonuclease Oy-like [Leptopilina boulardi]|uniref:ribonuclease Oy-like n=1 Tax=Leptopilina boulardi TaxID=63433 RepID=UPI0021F643DC|nr:ribonuclease Oy-like [Leptopilina boulardi]
MKANVFLKFGILLGVSFIQLSHAGPHDFDILLFAQQWAKSLCFQYNKPPNNCYLPQHNDWTVHGIWPSKINQRGPESCKQIQFRPQELSSIKSHLDSYWLSIHGPNANGFWKHEWDKHGTCSVVMPLLNTQLKYFQTGLNLNAQYNIGAMLQKGGIVPGRSYSIHNIMSTLNQGLKASPQVTCISKKGTQYIQEVRLCFNKQLKLINCKGNLSYETNCDPKKNVEYPRK